MEDKNADGFSLAPDAIKSTDVSGALTQTTSNQTTSNVSVASNQTTASNEDLLRITRKSLFSDFGNATNVQKLFNETLTQNTTNPKPKSKSESESEPKPKPKPKSTIQSIVSVEEQSLESAINTIHQHPTRLKLYLTQIKKSLTQQCCDCERTTEIIDSILTNINESLRYLSKQTMQPELFRGKTQCEEVCSVSKDNSKNLIPLLNEIKTHFEKLNKSLEIVLKQPIQQKGSSSSTDVDDKQPTISNLKSEIMELLKKIIGGNLLETSDDGILKECCEVTTNKEQQNLCAKRMMYNNQYFPLIVKKKFIDCLLSKLKKSHVFLNLYAKLFKQINKPLFNPGRMNKIITHLYDLYELQKDGKTDENKIKDIQDLLLVYILDNIETKEELKAELTKLYSIIRESVSKMKEPINQTIINLTETIEGTMGDQSDEVNNSTKIKEFCNILRTYLGFQNDLYLEFVIAQAMTKTLERNLPNPPSEESNADLTKVRNTSSFTKR